MAEEPAGGAKIRPVHWVSRSHQDLLNFPDEAQREVGFALWFAQRGDKHPSAKPLKGFGGAGVLEIVQDFRSDTYRVVYTRAFRESRVRAACVSEEKQDSNSDAKA